MGLRLDPAKYEIFFNKLDQLLNESQQVVRYLSASAIVREAGEAMESFYLPTGEGVDIAAGILMHFMNITRGIRYMNENDYKAEDIGIYEGDQFVNNDAYIGGMHCPDTCLIAPFFYQSELLGYVGAVSHTTETGGIEPGGMCPSATEAWHDGMIIPVVKIVEKGNVRRDIMNMFLRGTRDPRTWELDLKARMAGNERALKRLNELVDEFGAEFFKQATLSLVDEGEVQTREKLKEFRPGTYSCRTYCDALGAGNEQIAVIQVDLEITAEGGMTVSCPVISPQKPCYNNAFLPAAEATIIYTLMTQLMYDARWNSGIARPLTIDIPPGSRLNADSSQSVGYATVGIATVFCAALTIALSRAFFAAGKQQEVQAGSAASSNSMAISGIDYLGRRCATTILSSSLTWPGGGRIDSDGVHNFAFFNPWNYIPDCEGEEAKVPLLHLYTGLLPDSAAPGKNRSGYLGAHISAIHNSDVTSVIAKGMGGKISGTQGMYGGYAGPGSRVLHVKATDLYERIQQGRELAQHPADIEDITKSLAGNVTNYGACMPATQCKSGDVLSQIASGAGGLGDPIERDPEGVLADYKDGRVSLSTCENVYGVKLDPETFQIDIKKTENLRAARRKERLAKGVPGIEFIKSLVKKRAKREFSQPVLDFYDELLAFSPEFRVQIEQEKEAANQEVKPLIKITSQKELMDFTPYIKIVADDQGKQITVCSKCGFAFAEATADYKLFCLIYERDPAEIYPAYLAPDKEWAIYREFYCPECAAQIEVEQCPPCMPIIPESKIKGING